MRRKITVEIDIDTESNRGYTQFAGTENPDTYRIIVRRDIMDAFDSKLSPAIALAHECGHMIGYLFELPATKAEPRPLRPGDYPKQCGNYGQRVLNSENEAWDIAELALQVKSARDIAIAGYERDYLRKD